MLACRYICSVIAQQGDNPDRELFKTLTEFLLNKTFMVGSSVTGNAPPQYMSLTGGRWL